MKERVYQKKLVKLHRIQGGILPNASEYRFVLDGDKLKIYCKRRLYVTFKDKKRVVEYWIKRGETAEVFTADVNKVFFDKIMKERVPQRLGKAYPDKPQYGDYSKTKFSIGIPENYFKELIDNMENVEILKFD